MAFTKSSLVKDVLADTRACAILETHLPGSTTHPMVDEALYLTLDEVASFPQALFIRKQVQAILAELAALDSAA
jgi:hypothetical protein